MTHVRRRHLDALVVADELERLLERLRARRDQAHELVRAQPDYGDRPALDEGAWEPENVGACRASGARLDSILESMVRLGLDPHDIAHLERLSDPEIRRKLGTNTEYFAHYLRENVIAYLSAWADLLEAQLALEPMNAFAVAPPVAAE